VVLVALVSLLMIIDLRAQSGGKSVFQVLTLAPSARTAALGGNYISVRDSDIVLAQFNPAIASLSSTRSIHFNQSFYYGGSGYSNIGVAHHLLKENITLIGGFQYLQHGDLTAADEYGNKTGTFHASEMVMLIGASKKLFDPLSIGINLKYIFSQLESYNSSGLGIDLGALYTFKDGRQSMGLTIRNMGTQWDLYQDTRESLPLDILLGYSQRLEHVPVIFTISAHDLNRWQLRYESVSNEVSIFGEPAAAPSAFSQGVDNLFRHLIFSTEILLGKYAPLRLRLSYHHQRHQELKDLSYRGLSGFAGGFGIHLSRLDIDYGLANYHLAGSIHSIGIAYRWR